MRSKKAFSVLGAAALGLVANTASAAPALRVQVDQRGDFVLLGNTLGHDCGNSTPAPVVGTVGACGNSQGDSAPDILWRADEPAAGQAAANTSITVANARSTAMLALPPGATVTHAYLYWAGAVTTNTSDPTAVLERPGVFSSNVNAVAAHRESINNHFAYQSVADVTALVRQHGAGAYRVGGVDTRDPVNLNNDTSFAGWWMAVFYELATEPPRNLALFDGLDQVRPGNPANATLSGFRVPNAGFDGKLGVIAFEGDSSLTGDQLFFNGGAALTNALNPSDDFFNGTRSDLGAAVSNAGDLPQLTGGAGSMSGIDIDVIDIKSKLTAGLTQAPISATSTGDYYLLGGFVTSISTFRPDFTTSEKTVKDVNGGGLLPGDVLEYTIVVKNTGNDASVGTVLTDPLPAGVTFVPGSIAIAAGANSGAKTDATGDDQADYNAATRTVTVRLGTGANATQGGSLAVDASTTVTLRVTVDANAAGVVANQATITAAGVQGAPASSAVTDGNGPVAGNPPTTVVVDACDASKPCAVPTPFCKTDAHPYVCVECGSNNDCPGLRPTCDLATNTCGCVPSGAEVCDGKDNNCDGVIDEGFPAVCVGCTTDPDCGNATSGRVCNDTSLVCVDGCRGQGGNGCPSGKVCSSKTNAIGTCVDASSDAGAGCTTDADCGGALSGRVCNEATSTCVDGCRGQGGNGCPSGKTCSSETNAIGTCGGSGSGGDAGAAGADDDILAQGNGILCNARPNGSSGSGVALLAVGGMAILAAVRRRRPRA